MSKGIKLHIGCGKKYLPGYKHLDVIADDHIDFVCEAHNLKMIEDASVSEIYACHILEHIKRHEVDNVLKEWYRVLEIGGSLRVAVPDFKSIVDEYTQNNNLASLLGLLYGGQTHEYNFHYMAYNFDLLSNFLKKSGFKKIQKYDWHDFLPVDYDDFSRAYLPHMDFENGRHISLNVLAFK